MRTALPFSGACPSLPVRSGGRGKHAAPRETLSPTARAGLAGGLAVALLPFGAGAAAASGSSAGTPTTASGTPGSVQAVAQPEPATGTASTQPAPAAQSSDEPSAEPSAESSAAPRPERAAPAEQAPERATTTLRFRAPARDADGRVPVSVRLLADGRWVKNGSVTLERRTASGWTRVGRLLTNAQGLGAGTLRVPATSDLRATYVGTSTRTPAETAARTVVVPLVDAPAASSARARTLLSVASAQVGKPYRFGAVGPTSFDCSGFTRYVYSKIGKSLPHNSHAQERATTRVSRAAAVPGDLVFIKDVAGHVGIYAGNGMMYDAPRAGKDVTLRRIWTSNYVLGRVA